MLTMLQHNLPNVVYIQYIEKTFIRINPKDKNIKKNALVTSEVVLCIWLTLWGLTGSQLAFMFSCVLKRPSKASWISCIENTHTAEPGMELGGVVKMAYTREWDVPA